MKLIGIYTKSHRVLKDEWFLPTLQDDYDVQLNASPLSGHGRYMEDDWVKGVILKSEIIIQAIKDNRGEVIVYSDVDVQFFSPTKKLILTAIKNHDIVCQKDDPHGNLCTGFFAVRCNDKTLRLWQQVRSHLDQERRDQIIFNRILRGTKDIRYKLLPTRLFGAGTFNGQEWSPHQDLRVSTNPVMHHANWTRGLKHKIDQLKTVKAIVEKGVMGIAMNNLRVHLHRNLKTGKDQSKVVSATQE